MPPLTLPDPVLTDGVVTLREPLPEDRDAVVAAVQDPEIPRWTTVPSPYGPAEYAAFLDQVADRLDTGYGMELLVIDGAGALVGMVGLYGADGERPELGYWTAPGARGRGLTVRAVRLLRDHAAALGLAQVDLVIHVDNVASQRVAAGAGFATDGERVHCARGGTAGDPAHLRFTWRP